jgi:hypothetical protein
MLSPTTVHYQRQALLNYLALPNPETANFVLPSPWRIALKNLQMGITQVLDLTDSVMIGRDAPAEGAMPFINMAPYEAQQLGVSRHHVILKREGNRVYIVDNNSSNGVVLNEEILRPGIAYPVKHGDTFSMGKMLLQICFLRNPFTR